MNTSLFSQINRRFDKSYDSLTIVTKPRGREKVIYFDSQKRIRKIEHYNFFKLKHGRTITFDSTGKVDSKTIYKYNAIKDSLKNRKGVKSCIVLTYGHPINNWTPDKWKCQDEIINHYSIWSIPVAGCVVSHKIVRKANRINFCYRLRHSLRFGFNWEKKMNTQLDQC